MRALGSATIAFGLVSIPVKLFSSYESATAIRFNQIDQRSGSRVKQQLVSAKTGEPVPREEIVKGYEFAKDQYVLFTAEELKAIEATANNTIDIAEFARAGDVDRIYLDRVYYLGPDKGGARAYRLLSKALRQTGRVAIAKYAARGKEYLVMVRPHEDGLVMEQLRFADEVRPFSEVPIDDAEVRDAELELALQLIEQSASEEFQLDRYHDEVRARVMGLIERKVEGEDISLAPAEQAETKIIDIMSALKASLGAEGEGGERKPARRAAGPAAKAAKAGTRKKTTRKKRASS